MVTASQTSLVLDDLDNLMSTGKGRVLQYEFASCFLMIRPGSWVFEKETMEVKCRALHSVLRVHAINVTYQWMLTLMSWLMWGMSGFSTVKLLSFLLSILCPLEGVTVHRPHLTSRQLCTPSLRAECHRNYLEFCAGDFPPPSNLFSHLFLSVLTHEHLFYTLSYNSILHY